MTGKRFKKLLMSLRVPRNQVEYARRVVACSNGLLSYDIFYRETIHEVIDYFVHDLKDHTDRFLFAMPEIEILTTEEHSTKHIRAEWLYGTTLLETSFAIIRPSTDTHKES